MELKSAKGSLLVGVNIMACILKEREKERVPVFNLKIELMQFGG